MKICDDLRQAVLQAAIQGKLTTQRKEDGDARDLLKQIAAEKAQLIKEKKIKKEKPLPEITEEEIPFEVPENWVWVRMGNIGDTNIGLTYKPSDISDNGTIVLRSSNIKNERMDYSDIIKVSCTIPSKNIAQIGDILICVRNGSRKLVGKCAIIDTANMAFGAFMAIFRSSCNRYIKLFLNSRFFRQDLDGINTTTINQITQNMIKLQLIPLPPLAEQHRIVAKVEKLMAEIDELEKVENELHELKTAFPGDMKAALLQAAMQGKLTTQRKEDGDARDLLKQIAKEKAKLIKEKKIKKEKPLPEITEEEIPFEVPDNWVWCRLGDAFLIEMGSSPEGSSINNIGMGMEFHQGKSMFGSCYLKQCEVYTSKPIKTANDNSLLLCVRAPVGKVNITKRNICIGRGLAALSCLCNIDIKFLYLFMLNLESVFNEKATGSTFKAITADIVKKQIIPLPPLAEQQRIVAKLEKLLPLCDGLVEE